uniref:Uncharacterized protein n=1 Tax=Oryza glumipatula TaxID=40148 RepID=A0A0E0A8A4_9ORYZ
MLHFQNYLTITTSW